MYNQVSPNKATEAKRRVIKEYQTESSQVSLDGKTKQIAPKTIEDV